MNVYRYAITPEGAPIKMPAGAKVISTQINSTQCVASDTCRQLVEPEAGLEDRIFIVRGTGGPVTQGMQHIQSVVMPDGFHVFHIFEIVA